MLEKMVKNMKKAISPVVATALLLVVAVVAVVGFQTWFATYQSDIVSDVEARSDQGSSITIERLEVVDSGNSTVYYRNSASSAVTVTEVRVVSSGVTYCTNSSGVSSVSANSINSSTTDNCATAIVAGTSYNVVVVTTGGVYSETEVAR